MKKWKPSKDIWLLALCAKYLDDLYIPCPSVNIDACFHAGTKQNAPHKVRCAICVQLQAGGTPGETRTHYIPLRRRALYPGEVRGQLFSFHLHGDRGQGALRQIPRNGVPFILLQGSKPCQERIASPTGSDSEETGRLMGVPFLQREGVIQYSAASSASVW